MAGASTARPDHREQERDHLGHADFLRNVLVDRLYPSAAIAR
jgi:hypothetical protein